jgi:hypothetical protein
MPFTLIADCRRPLPARNSQKPFGVLICHYKLTNDGPAYNDTKVIPMLRLTTLRLTSDGRLLGFDTGDWSMLLGGFVLAGLLTLFV